MCKIHMLPFVGRVFELQKLKDLQAQNRSSIVVIRGRRRIGKSRLANECAKGKRFLSFSGQPPLETNSSQDQRNAFIKQLQAQTGRSISQHDDWTDILYELAQQISCESTVILFDEISWMAQKDPTLISKLKVWWDLYIHPLPNVMVIFCGSVSTWIEENIINSTGFYGRISLNMELGPLTLPEAAAFLKVIGFKGSPYEMYQILSCMGCVPWYLEQIQPNMMAEDNIKRLCFEKDGVLFLEFNTIFHDLFSGKGTTYKQILDVLKDGMKTLAEIRTLKKLSHSGTISQMMSHLETCGFVTKHHQWSIKEGKLGKQSLYRLSDPYLRFYLKYIEPNKNLITSGYYEAIPFDQIRGITAMMGYQLESLLLQNRLKLLEAIGINTWDCLFDNPFVQRVTKDHKGCQIDYLIQTRTRNLFLCEFKFNLATIRTEIIKETQNRMDALVVPRNFALVPVLFHLGEVSEKVYDKNFFYKIINIEDLLR